MLLLITALIAVCVGTIVPWLNYTRYTRERIIRENQPLIKEVRHELENEKNANGKADPDIERLLDGLENGRIRSIDVPW